MKTAFTLLLILFTQLVFGQKSTLDTLYQKISYANRLADSIIKTENYDTAIYGTRYKIISKIAKPDNMQGHSYIYYFGRLNNRNKPDSTNVRLYYEFYPAYYICYTADGKIQEERLTSPSEEGYVFRSYYDNGQISNVYNGKPDNLKNYPDSIFNTTYFDRSGDTLYVQNLIHREQIKKYRVNSTGTVHLKIDDKILLINDTIHSDEFKKLKIIAPADGSLVYRFELEIIDYVIKFKKNREYTREAIYHQNFSDVKLNKYLEEKTKKHPVNLVISINPGKMELYTYLNSDKPVKTVNDSVFRSSDDGEPHLITIIR
jgi:hypothetical protein